jgi:hypothetical protein
MQKEDTAIHAFQCMKESLISKGYVSITVLDFIRKYGKPSYWSNVEGYETVGLDGRHVAVILLLSKPYSYPRQRGVLDADGHNRRCSIEVMASVKGVNDVSEVERLVGYFNRYGKPIVNGRKAEELQEKLFS